MAESKKKSSKKIADVAHPGKSAPAGNSKSVIVTNRPIMKDPMVVEDTAPKDEGEKVAVKTRETVVAPVTDPEIENDAKEEKTDLKDEDDKKTIAVLAEEAAVKKTEETEQEGSESKEDAETDKPEEKPMALPADESPDEKPISATEENEPKADSANKDGDPVSGDGPTTQSVTEADEEELAAQEKHDAEIQKLIDSKQYELPINTVERRRSKRVVIFGILLSLLLLVAWADIALDANLIKISGVPHTHLFDQQTTASNDQTTPVIPSKSYTSKLSNISFKYPASWTLAEASTAAKDSVLMSPKADSGGFEAGSTSITFTSPYTLGETQSYKVLYVKYQKLPHKIGGPVYLRDLVFQDAKGFIKLNSSLTNTKDQSVGQTILSTDGVFFNASSTVASSFNIYAVKTTNKKVGFASTSDAKAFISTPTYQQARSILLSTTSK